MTSPEPTEELDDKTADLFPLLDSYVEGLHAGEQTNRDHVLTEYPALASTLGFLDALHRLAEPAMPSVAAADEPVAGRDFGNFTLLEEIGRGGMGVVYRARQKGLDRIVALKMILSGHLASPEQVRRFHAEARTAARLQHPHIVRIFESGELLGQHYFAMDYIAGPSLGDIVRSRTMSADDAARLVAKVARAVDHLHAAGIVHRDLKPSNLLLDAAGEPYVTDFGLAKLLTADSTATQSGAIAGTPSYMPPEQAAAKSELMGPRGDVYSLGAILYELLTGRPPFRAKTPLDTLVQVLESEPLPPRRLCPHIPREMELICLRCLEKAPEKRYASAAALADDLDRFLRREPVEARPPDLWHVLRRWSRRQPALASRLAALAVVAVIVQTSFHFAGTVSTRLHAQVMALLAGWAAVSIVFQRLLGNERWSLAARFAWAGADVLLLSAIFWLQGAFGTVLMAWYTLLLTASGLWVRERIVWFTTVLSAAAYAGLMLDAVQRGELPYPHHHAIFLASLPLLGFVVAYQVKRVRALSRFYERRS